MIFSTEVKNKNLSTLLKLYFYSLAEVVRTNLYLSRQRDHRRRPKTTTTPACPASLLTQFDDVCPYGTYLCDPTILDDYLLNYTIVVVSN